MFCGCDEKFFLRFYWFHCNSAYYCSFSTYLLTDTYFVKQRRIEIVLLTYLDTLQCEWYFSKLKLILTYPRAATPYDKITLGICAA